MKTRVIVVVMCLATHGAAAANEATGGEAKTTSMSAKTPLESALPPRDAKEVKQFIAGNPDAPVDMSHLKSLDPELAEVLICEDEVVRPVRRTRKVSNIIVATETVRGETTTRYDTKSKTVEQTVSVPGRALYLNGLESLDADVAEVLGRHKGDLALNGLKELSHEAAGMLETHVGLLSLDGLEVADEIGSAVEVFVNHHGPVSLKGLTRMSAQTYYTLVAPWEVHAEHVEDFRPLLPPDVIVEQPTTVMPVVRWSQMPGEDTLANYLRRISEQADVEVEVDKAALQRLKVADSIRVSAPFGRLLKKHDDGSRSVVRLVPDAMRLDEAVAWLAHGVNAHCPAGADEEVVAFMTGGHVVLTLAPKQEQPPSDRIALSTGEIAFGYRCRVSDEMKGLQGDRNWPGDDGLTWPGNTYPLGVGVGTGMGGMGGGAF